MPFWYKRFFILSMNITGWLDSYKILVSNSEKIMLKLQNIYLGKKSIIINNGVEICQ